MIRNSDRRQFGRQRLSVRNIMLRIVLKTLLFGSVYLLLWYGLDSYGALANSLRRFFGDGFYYAFFQPLFDNKAIVSFMLFLGLVFFIVYREMRRLMGYLTLTRNALEVVADAQRPIPEFPDDVKAMEVSVRNLRQEIEENRRQAAESEHRKNDLVVYLAHDLKTPLSSVIGYLTLLAEAPDMSLAQRAKYSKIALDKAQRLEELINEFFDITRFSLQNIELEMHEVDLSMLLRQVADEFYPIFEEKELRPILEIQDGLRVYGDPDKLERVFDNLLRNAVSYGDEHTELYLRAVRVEETVQVAVRNRGPRIPPEKLERIFEKYYRADSARGTGTGGAGLGLAIARKIATLHGGTLTATSGAVWTEFLLTLPLFLEEKNQQQPSNTTTELTGIAYRKGEMEESAQQQEEDCDSSAE